MKRTSRIEILGIVMWLILPFVMYHSLSGDFVEYLIFWWYIIAILLSILDILITSKALTLAAFLAWAVFGLIGFLIENPDAIPLLARSIHLDRPHPGSGYVMGAIAVLSMILLWLSLEEERTIEDKPR